MTPPGNKTKKTSKQPTSAKQPRSRSGKSKAKQAPVQQKGKEAINAKETEEHRKKIHAAAKEAQNAVIKALEGMADQTVYKEEYEE